MQADGSAKRLNPVRSVQIGPDNPKLPYEVRQAEVGIPATQASTQRTLTQERGDRISNATNAASAPYTIAKARADAERAAAEAALAQRAANNPTLTDDQRKAAMQAANLDALVGQINRVQELYDQNVAGASPFEWLPARSDMAEFNAAAAGLAEQGLAAFRVPGVGSQSDTELKQFVEANRPHSSSLDSANVERLRQLRMRTDAARRGLGLAPAQWGGTGAAMGGMIGRQLANPPPRQSQKRAWWDNGTAPRKTDPLDDEVMSYINRARGGK